MRRLRCALPGLVLLGLLAAPAPVAALGEGRGDRLCFASNPPLVHQFVLDVVRRGEETFSFEGQIVFVHPTLGFTLPAYGSGRLRADGKLELMLTAGVQNVAFPVYQVWSGRMSPPDFETGFGFGMTLPAGPGPFTFASIPCPETFPDTP